MQMANYLLPPPFSNKRLQTLSNILENKRLFIKNKHQKTATKKIKGEKTKVLANLHKVLKTLSSTVKCQMGEGFRIKFGIALPELMIM